ncbi:MAG: ABC transporter permease [Acidobacteria bacterium]|nr:ABC transporter permease [Acidobacteriota bacterium]
MRQWLVGWAARAVPEVYRDEVLSDLGEQHPTLVSLCGALLRSGWDARRQMRTGGEGHTGERFRGVTADVRSAWRVHRSRPLSAVAIVLVPGLAIGLNTAIYSMVDTVLLRPLPFRDADRVVFLWKVSPHLDREPLAPARALDFRARVSAFEGAALIGHMSMTVTGRGAARRWFGASVSSSFFDVLGASPALGRTFLTEESDRDVVVLSHSLWVDQFGASLSVVGQSVVMNGRPRTVVGVMPANFYWPSITPESSAIDPPLFWSYAPAPDVPERPGVSDGDITFDRHTGFLRLVARVSSERSVEAAQLEASVVATELGRLYPPTDAGRSVALVTAQDQLLGAVRQPMWFVFLASGLVVLGACVNIGGVLLVRQAGRRREFAVRSALGAGRWRLARQLTIEAAMLAGVGGLVGVGLGMAGLRAIVALAPASVGRLDGATLNGAVLPSTTGATLVTGVMLGALSAIALWRDRSADDLRGTGTGGRGRGRLRQMVVTAEVALAMTLLIGAVLFGQSLLRLKRVDIGFDPVRLLTFDVLLTGERAEDQTKQVDFFDDLVEQVRLVPGVLSAAGAVTLPIRGDDFGAGAFVEGRPLPPLGEDRRVGFQIVGDQWFATLGMRVVDGRDFGPSDTSDGPLW